MKQSVELVIISDTSLFVTLYEELAGLCPAVTHTDCLPPFEDAAPGQEPLQHFLQAMHEITSSDDKLFLDRT